MCGLEVNARLQNRPRTGRRPPDFASSSETPRGYVGQAVLERVYCSRGVLLSKKVSQSPRTWWGEPPEQPRRSPTLHARTPPSDVPRPKKRAEPLAVAQRVTTPSRTRTMRRGRYGKQRLIASNNGLTVSTVSSPIFETRKLFPLIFP